MEKANEIYESYFAEEDSPVLISTLDQLLKVCNLLQEGEVGYITENNKIYKCTSSSNYKLISNISLNDTDYLTQYPNLFEEKNYIEQEWQARSEVVKTATATGAEQTYTIAKDGKYVLEVWGANGGSYKTSYAAGGTGGYSKGKLELSNGQTLYLYVGKIGTYGTSTTSTATSGGGFNGGGNAGYRGGAGGGASDIRIGGNTLNHRLIVAGGGRTELMLMILGLKLLEEMEEEPMELMEMNLPALDMQEEELPKQRVVLVEQVVAVIIKELTEQLE